MKAVEVTEAKSVTLDDEPEAKSEVVVVESDPRPHLNLVFIGHVDAGKSTISGNILFLTGQVDPRTIEKFEREAKSLNRDSWFLAFIMDTNEEERAKGKTVEVGRAQFDTPEKRYTILDAPGHKNYVPNMIAGAAQADVGCLVISARRGEFEAGFDKGGQTREHALLAKTLGVQKLVVVVNKMDEPTVNWSKERFDDICNKLRPFLRSCGFAVKRDVFFVPISGLSGINLLEPVSPAVCAWCQPAKSLIQLLNSFEITGRDASAPVRLPVLDRYLERGLVISGKLETGTIRVGDRLRIQPGNTEARVDEIMIGTSSVRAALPGENLLVKVRGPTEDDVHKGYVLSSSVKTCPVVTRLTAQMQLLDLLDHRQIMTAGYSCILHAHTAIEECSIVQLVEVMQRDKSGNMVSNKRAMFAKSNQLVTAIIEMERGVCVEPFAVTQPLGRFTLRDEGRTIAIGKVLSIEQ